MEENKRIADLEEAVKVATAALAATISLLKRSSKKSAPSNKMFDQMMIDYENALTQARTLYGVKND